MKYNYSPRNLKEEGAGQQRLFEILPGALSWSVIIGMMVLSLVKPLIASVIMIAFLLYWVLRLIYVNIFLVLSYIKLAAEKNTDWMQRIDGIDKDNLAMPKSKDIYHLVIIPVLKETKEIIEPGVARIIKGSYPARRILVVVAVEESASDEVKKGAYRIQEEYKTEFMDLLVTAHPNNLRGEARVKGANTSFAAKHAKDYFTGRNIPFENIIVSCFDADTVPEKDYFSCLTYHFMTNPKRTKTSYQPVPVYYNNIWNVPAFARIIDIGTSFFQLVEATDPRKLVTFSSHSMSFKALVDVDYWPVDMISDDSAIFWKAFIHYDGDYRTMPIYTTVSMDIASGRDIKETVINIYKQKRRWAWGVENFPVVVRAFIKSKSISLYKRTIYLYKLLDTFISWATWSFLLSFASWLPAFFAGREFSTSTVFYTAPRIRTTIFSLASVGIIICMLISILMLPPRKGKRHPLKKIQHALEWLFIPVVILALSAIPALDAQTRLALGKYMEFWHTEKYR